MAKYRVFPGELSRRERRHGGKDATLPVFRTSDTRSTGFCRSALHLGLSMDTVALGPVPSENFSLAVSLSFQQRYIFFHSSFWFFSNRIFSWCLITFLCQLLYRRKPSYRVIFAFKFLQVSGHHFRFLRMGRTAHEWFSFHLSFIISHQIPHPSVPTLVFFVQAVLNV
jgi:hypothetical protein